MDISSVNIIQTGYKNSMGASSETSNDAITKTTERTLVQPTQDIMHKSKFELSISEEAVAKAIERANKAIEGEPKHVEYSIYKPHGDIVVKIVNSETNEVIREYPPEKILELLDKLRQISGTIIDEKR